MKTPGVAEQYQHGVLHAHAHQSHADRRHTARRNRVRRKAASPGMLKTRGYTLKLPADWPPESVTVEWSWRWKEQDRPAKVVGVSKATRLPPSSPIASLSTASKVTIEVRRAAGLTARRSELGRLQRCDGATAWNLRRPQHDSSGSRSTRHPYRCHADRRSHWLSP